MGSLRATSHGNIKLRSASPYEHPVIKANLFSIEEDRCDLRDALKLTREIFAQRAFDPYRGKELQPGLKKSIVHHSIYRFCPQSILCPTASALFVHSPLYAPQQVPFLSTVHIMRRSKCPFCPQSILCPQQLPFLSTVHIMRRSKCPFCPQSILCPTAVALFVHSPYYAPQ